MEVNWSPSSSGRIAVAMKDGFTIQMLWQLISMKIPFVWCQMRDRSNSYEKRRPTLRVILFPENNPCSGNRTTLRCRINFPKFRKILNIEQFQTVPKKVYNIPMMSRLEFIPKISTFKYLIKWLVISQIAKERSLFKISMSRPKWVHERRCCPKNCPHFLWLTLYWITNRILASQKTETK